MANTFKFGNKNWAVKKDYVLAYNDENDNFKPLPFDFTRDSTATYVDSDGLIKTAQKGIARIDYLDNTDGHLLLEPSRTNYVQYSEDISSWAQSYTPTITSNIAVSPDGNTTADGLQSTSTSNYQYLKEDITVTANSTYTASLFVKKETSETAYMGIGLVFTGGTTDVGYGIIDSVNGTGYSADPRIPLTVKVDDYGDYWRFAFTGTDSGSNTALQFAVYGTLSTNGTTVAVGAGSVRTIWGIQLEKGSYATSYIPTEGSSVTRSNEDIGLTLPDDASFDSSNGFTIYGQFLTNGGSGTSSNFLEFTGNTGYAGFGSTGVTWRGRVNNGTTNQLHNSAASITTTSKLSVSFDGDGYSMYANGTSFNTGSTDISTITSIDSISFRNNTEEFGSLKIRDVRIYNTRLSNSELETLTT